MYIRCPGCKASTRLEMGFHESKARCGSCGRVWSLAAIGDLGATPQERFESAQTLSVEQSIDLASAYSVLLGLMSLDDACSLKPASKTGKSSDEAYTLEGDRVIRASNLARKHGLTMSLAFDVAGGKLSLRQAMSLQREGPSRRVVKPLAPDRRNPERNAWLAAVAVGLAVGGTVMLVAGRGQDVVGMRNVTPRIIGVAEDAAPGSTEALLPAVHNVDPPPPAYRVTTDEQGRVTRISGRTPVGILQAYCGASDGQEACEPVGIEPVRPHRTGVRMGVVRKTWGSGREHAIWIRRAPEGGTWSAGSGLKPLRAEPLPR